jgi:hypothetical protein
MPRIPQLLRGWIALAALAAAPATLHAQQPELPNTPAGQKVAALLAAVRDGTEPTVRAFVNGSMDGQFQAMPMSQHVDMFQRMRGDFGRAPIQSLREVSPREIEVTFAGDQGPLTLSLSVEPAPPHRISGLGVGGGDGPRRRRAEGGEPIAAARPFDDAARRAVIDSAAALLIANYVAGDTGRVIAEHLRARLASGAYASITDPAAFATALTTDLRAVNGDRHLRALVGGSDGPARVVTAGAPAAGAGDSTAYRYLDRVDVLSGNVGYLKLGGIPGAPEAFDEMTRALRSLGSTDAMIIDLRGSRGGSAQMANFLISHFTRPGLLSLAVSNRSRSDTTLRRTLDEVPGPRRLDVPLFVLIDDGAASASEDIPFVLRNLGRATLVGETTAGAGRNNRFFPLPNGLSLSVSITRVWDPCTGREWERSGVAPDLRVPSAQALDAALRAIAERRGGPQAQIPQASCRQPAA